MVKRLLLFCASLGLSSIFYTLGQKRSETPTMINMINNVPKSVSKIITKNQLLLFNRGLGISFEQAFKLTAKPPKSLLFCSATIGVVRKALMLGIGP